VVAPAAEAAQHLGPVDVRQAEVEHDQVDARLLRQSEALLAGAGVQHLVPVRPQPLQQERQDLRFVLDDQELHGTGPCPAAGPLPRPR
jgi:hypothetical protein